MTDEIHDRTQDPASHDAFFLFMLDDDATAVALIRGWLPPAMLRAIVPSSLKRIPGNFVDPELRRHYTDALYSVRLGGAEDEAEQDGYVFVLFEHKSAAQAETALQLLRYKVQIWTRWLEDGNRLPLPPVVAIVVHQGPPAWPHGSTLAPLFGAQEAGDFAETIPDFQFCLIDLARESDHLSDHQRAQAMLLALKYARRADLAAHLDTVLRPMILLTKLEIERTLRYLEQGKARVAPAMIIDVIATIVNDGTEVHSMGVLELLEERGLEKGIARGRAEGRVEGLAEGSAAGSAAMLMRLLGRRFGTLSDADRERIATADTATRETWADRVLDAPDLASVFRD